LEYYHEGIYMKGRKLILIFLFIVPFITVPCIRSMERACPDATLQVYAIPGQNGSGSEPEYVANLLGQNVATIVPIETPSAPDLGQERCIRYLRAVLSKNDSKNAIIHATSQGTATTLNYLANEDKGKCIKGLILEAPLATGNSAIIHTLNGPLKNKPVIANLPFSYYWVPYCAKASFPCYWPSGKQPIKSIDKIPTNIPIILIHSKNDPQLSYNDTCALYYGLRSHGNNNVYLISKDGCNHLQIMQTEADKQLIRSILERHNVLPYSDSSEKREEINLTEYQPDHMQFKELYDSLINKERNHDCLRYAGCVLGFSICLALFKVVSRFLGPCIRS